MKKKKKKAGRPVGSFKKDKEITCAITIFFTPEALGVISDKMREYKHATRAAYIREAVTNYKRR